MKELVKPNQLEENFELVDMNCEQSGCRHNGCADGSIEKENDLLF